MIIKFKKAFHSSEWWRDARHNGLCDSGIEEFWDVDTSRCTTLWLRFSEKPSVYSYRALLYEDIYLDRRYCDSVPWQRATVRRFIKRHGKCYVSLEYAE